MSANPNIRPRYQHWCAQADHGEGAPINEFDTDIIYCRCYTSHDFFAAQDAVEINLACKSNDQ